MQAKDELNATVEDNFTVTMADVYEDTDRMDFGIPWKPSTGSNINDPTSTPFNHGLILGTPLMAMPLICPAMEMICLVVGMVWRNRGTV